MAVVKSSLGYYNVFAALSLEENHPDFITVGPFCDGNLSAVFIQRKCTRSRRIPMYFGGLLQLLQNIIYYAKYLNKFLAITLGPSPECLRKKSG